MKVRPGQVIRLSLFCLTGVACASFVANTLSVPVRGSTDSYSFEFTDGNRQGTTWIIAEAKGGESPQSSFRKILGKLYEQGTMPHTMDTIQAMKDRNDLTGSRLEWALDSNSSDRVLFVKVTAQIKPDWKGLEGLPGQNARSLGSLADENALNAELNRQLETPLSDVELESALEVVVKIWELKP